LLARTNRTGQDTFAKTKPPRTQYAEFNVLADPEAAASIFSNKTLAGKTTLIPLDLSHQVLATEEVRELLLYGPEGPKTGRGKSTLRIMLVELLMFFAKTYRQVVSRSPEI